MSGFCLLSLTVAAGCGASPGNPVVIDAIDGDIELVDGREYVIESELGAKGSLFLGGRTHLIIRRGRVSFELSEDLEAGIYLTDSAVLTVEESTLTSNGKMYEIELRDQSSVESRASELRNHSAVKLFDRATLTGTDSLIEELRMDDRGAATLRRCEFYPNLQFRFSVEGRLVFPAPYAPIEEFRIDNAGSWSLQLYDCEAQGWQVDAYPETALTIADSENVNLGLRSNGRMDADLELVNPHGEFIDLALTEFGFDLSVENTEIYFMNLYLHGRDRLHITGESGRTTFLEVVLLDEAVLEIEDSHVFAQLAHANDRSRLTLRNCLIGSDDAEDPINSELAIKDQAVGIVEDSDLSNSDVVISGKASLSLLRCNYDGDRISIHDSAQIIVEDKAAPVRDPEMASTRRFR